MAPRQRDTSIIDPDPAPNFPDPDPNPNQAARYLRRFGIRHRLAPHTWSLVNHSEVKPGANAGATEDTEETEVVRWEGGVPPELLRRLKAAFAQDSPFCRRERLLFLLARRRDASAYGRRRARDDATAADGARRAHRWL